MISASFTVTKQDALALASRYYSQSQTVRRARLLGHLSVPVLMGLLGVLILCQSSADIQDMKVFAEARASTTEPGGPWNGGPAKSSGNTGALGGPPSVS
jgi:hypothetical protein